MITVISMLLMTLQASSEIPKSVKQEQPKTWTLEYPIIISPHIETYRGCLNSGVRVIGSKVNFEVQHRSDIPRCSEIESKAVAASIAKLVTPKRTTEIATAQVTTVFDTIRLIHIERGRDLDEHIRLRLEAPPLESDKAKKAMEAKNTAPVA